MQYHEVLNDGSTHVIGRPKMIKFCSPFTVYPNLEPIGSFYISLISILQGCFLSLICLNLEVSDWAPRVERSKNLWISIWWPMAKKGYWYFATLEPRLIAWDAIIQVAIQRRLMKYFRQDLCYTNPKLSSSIDAHRPPGHACLLQDLHGFGEFSTVPSGAALKDGDMSQNRTTPYTNHLEGAELLQARNNPPWRTIGSAILRHGPTGPVVDICWRIDKYCSREQLTNRF